MNKKQEAKINEILEEAGKLIEADEYSKVLELLEPIKDEKNGMVQCAIGVCVENLQGWQKALKWYKKGAENHSINAAQILANACIRGCDVELDLETILEYVDVAARCVGDVACQLYMGGELLYVCGDPDAFGLGVEYLTEAVTNGSTLAGELVTNYVALANNEVHNDEMVDIDNQVTELLSRELVPVSFDYGEIKPVEIDIFAATRGDVDAQARLGIYYQLGKAGLERDYDKALMYNTKAAEGGSTVAMYNLAIQYDYALGVVRDYEQAAKWYLGAAKAGDCSAYNKLAYLYLHGFGFEQNVDKAIAIYKKVAKFDNKVALLNLADIYFKGKFVERDVKVATTYYKKLIELGCDNGIIGLSNVAFKNKTMEKERKFCFKKLQKLANDGHPYAMFALARCYLYGVGTEFDKKNGLLWLNKACLNNEREALYLMGKLMEDCDVNAALGYYLRAARYGLVDAQVRYAELDQKTGKANIETAIALLISSAYHGEKRAALLLGDIFCEMKGMEEAVIFYEMARDLGYDDIDAYITKKYADECGKEKVFEYMTALAKRGSIHGMRMLAEAYWRGNVCEQSYEQAIFWYEKLAETQDKVALYYLGIAREKGYYGVDVDNEQLDIAEKYLERSAELGYSEAYVELGMLYASNCRYVNDLEHNDIKAVYYYTLAAKSGNRNALIKLSECYMYGCGVPLDRDMGERLLEKARRLAME